MGGQGHRRTSAPSGRAGGWADGQTGGRAVIRVSLFLNFSNLKV